LRSARRELALPAALSQRIRELGQRQGGTLFMTLLAAFKTLLHLYAGQPDVRVATLVANRSRPGTERLIGPLVNTVILRTDLSGDPTPHTLMRRVRATTLAAFAHQDLAFEALLETLAAERGCEAAGLVENMAQTLFWLHNAALRPSAIRAHKFALEEANPTMLLPLVTITKFDVVLMLREGPDGLAGCCIYKPHLFRAPMIDRLLRDFRKVLEFMVRKPEAPISAIRLPGRARCQCS
jgi:non-ribosomal peptide synthetase component F